MSEYYIYTEDDKFSKWISYAIINEIPQDIIINLIQNSLDTSNKIDLNGLLIDASSKKLEKVIKFLVTAGADIESISRIGCTPLMLVAALGHLELVKYFIELGANINKINDFNRTAMNYAFANEHSLVINFFENLWIDSQKKIDSECVPRAHLTTFDNINIVYNL